MQADGNLVIYLESTPETLAGRLLLVDALAMQLRTLRVARDAACGVCGGRGA